QWCARRLSARHRYSRALPACLRAASKARIANLRRDNPQRMGAALTYARRYALFTLVGIAGEDDLDASDICVPANASLPEASPRGLQLPPQTRGKGKLRGAAKAASPTALLTDESAAFRDRLLSEISGLASQDSAATWAGDALPAKNTL